MSDSDDDIERVGVDTGAGRWFVLEKFGAEFRLIGGPFQTEAAVERFTDNYKSPTGVDMIISVRCEGSWLDGVAHVKDAIARSKELRSGANP